jgi:translation initiation factor 4E
MQERHAERNLIKNMNSEHPLEKRYAYWFSVSDNSKKATDYGDAIKYLGSFGTVEEFWQYYSHLKKPDDVPPNTEYHVFQEGIRPMWEDEANKNGARWILRIKKGAASAFWEELLLGMIGEQFDVTDEICGVGVSIRSSEDIFSIWVRSGQDPSVKNSVKDTLKRIWSLGDSVYLEYKEHPTVQRHSRPRYNH